MAEDLSWDEVLRFFRMLGGTVDNITLKSDAAGRRLTAIDPEKPVQLRVPTNLLYRVEDLTFENDQLCLKPGADVGDAERLFFDAYQAGFSWGAGGRSQTMSFIEGLDRLPDAVRTLLAQEFGFEDLTEGDLIERTQKRFLECRSMHAGGTEFIAPVMELANHDSGGLARFHDDGGLGIHGAVKDEVHIAYGVFDSFSLFRTLGLVRREPGAFSQSTELQFEGSRTLQILADTSAAVRRGNTWIPQLANENGRPVLPFLMIGHRTKPRQPRGIFRVVAAESGFNNADEIFDIILQFNWGKFLDLLTLFESYEGDAVATLRTVVRYQLEAISHCIGSMDVETLPPAKQKVWSLSIS